MNVFNKIGRLKKIIKLLKEKRNFYKKFECIKNDYKIKKIKNILKNKRNFYKKKLLPRRKIF
jgi:hypothetical protein